jgi:membrane protein DedA with SNARE-associated domain
MPDLVALLTEYGHVVVFGWTLMEALGIPVPGMPLLITAGALAARGQLSFVAVVGLYTLAAFLGDLTWFVLGRIRGVRILRLICGLSLEPDTCVRQTQVRFDAWGLRALLVSKFVPGLSTVASPLAGVNRTPLGRFAIFDGAGAALYGVVVIGLGALFSTQVGLVIARLEGVGHAVFGWLVLALALWIGFKIAARRRFLRSLEMPRMTVDELRDRLASGEPVRVYDLRHGIEREGSPGIPGAIALEVDDLDSLDVEGTIVLYCA